MAKIGEHRRKSADLPGLKKDEVKVEVEDGSVLQIRGERRKEQGEKNDKWHLIERSSGKFLRRFRLPENAKLDEVKAAMENGVLTVTVPKEKVKKPELRGIITSKKDFGRGEREAQWVISQRTLHGLRAPDSSELFHDKTNYRELSEIAEQDKKRAEVARLRDLKKLLEVNEKR
ncbi:hypothetical protein ACS0TY_026703 [Phlomoides rotata]